MTRAAKMLNPGRRLAWSVTRYLIFWTVIAVVQARWYPTWLVDSRTGLQTILQTLPATLFALFVLAFTTVFVAVQQVVNVFSSRAPLILAEDERVRTIVAKTAAIAIAALLLGGQVADSQRPRHWVTAAVATLVLAAVVLVIRYGFFATFLIQDYSAPRTFVSRVVAPVEGYLNNVDPNVGEVRFRVQLLGQALRYALRRDDFEGAAVALEGLRNFVKAYCDASAVHPEARFFRFDDDPQQVEGWLGDDLRRVFVGASEEGLRLQLPQDDLDLIIDTHSYALMLMIQKGYAAEAHWLLSGLTQVATTPYQVTEGGHQCAAAPNHGARYCGSGSESQRTVGCCSVCPCSVGGHSGVLPATVRRGEPTL